MTPNPFLGLIFHWIGGFASASFYIPYRGVKNWAWETYWLVGGFFSWIIAPWILALFMTSDLLKVLGEASLSTLFWTYFFGVLWGFGGLTYGLTMRYLGLSLGMAIVLGFCAAFGTLIPPLFHGEFFTKILGTTSGIVIFLVSMVTKPKPIAELEGLVYGATPLPKEEPVPFYKNVTLWAILAVVLFAALNILFW